MAVRPLRMTAGMPFTASVQWLDSAQQPRELDDATATAHMRDRFLHETSDVDPVAVFATQCGDEGRIYLSLTAVQTAAIPPGVYVWDLLVDDPTEGGLWPRRPVHGSVIVEPAVTALEEES